MKITISKGLSKICIVLLLCLSLVLSTTACGQNKTANDKTDNTINNEANNKTDENLDDADSPMLTVEDLYLKNVGSSFLKLKISNIYNEVFQEKFSKYGKYIMLECEIMEDLYDSGFENNKKIIVPVLLNQSFTQEGSIASVGGTLDLQNFKTFLLSFDYIYIYSHSNSNVIYCLENDTSFQLESNIDKCVISSYELIPSVDGKVYIERIDAFLEENNAVFGNYHHIYGILNFCFDGISCMEFESNVRKLSKYFDDK